MSATVPYRDFYYPLNILLHVLTLEEGGVDYLHYGLFERNDEPIGAAQERSTALLLSRLPPPPARILDVGAGLGTTLVRLTGLGYQAVGITPDQKQIAAISARYGSAIDVRAVRFEDLDDGPSDTVIFQESSQYIDSEALFARAGALTRDVIVLDEFATSKRGELHLLDPFLAAARAHGFRLTEEVDLSAKAAPTIDYFRERLPQYRDRLISDLGISSQQVDELIRSGQEYHDNYRQGTYVYRLLRLQR
jgi:SAM-dependent methyltransferase